MKIYNNFPVDERHTFHESHLVRFFFPLSSLSSISPSSSSPSYFLFFVGRINGLVYAILTDASRVRLTRNSVVHARESVAWHCTDREIHGASEMTRVLRPTKVRENIFSRGRTVSPPGIIAIREQTSSELAIAENGEVPPFDLPSYNVWTSRCLPHGSLEAKYTAIRGSSFYIFVVARRRESERSI